MAPAIEVPAIEAPAIEAKPVAGAKRLALTTCAIGFVALGLAAIGGATLASQGDLTGAVTGEGRELVGPAILVFVALVFLAEQLVPAERRRLLARGHVHDAAYLVAYVAIVVPFITLLDAGWAASVQARAPWLLMGRISSVPGWGRAVAGFAVMDGANWFAHYTNHRIGAFWRLHAVHHSQEEMSVLTAFRAHPLVHLTFVLSTLPAVLLSANTTVAPAVISAYICLGALSHANVRARFGLLGYLVVSPDYHRLHHSTEHRPGINLGIALTVWDALAGRAVFPAAGEDAPATGLIGRPVPVERSTPSHSPVRLLVRQWIEPFFSE